jgi:hypothetical protein
MKSMLVVCLLSVTLAAELAAQGPKYGATATAEKNVDFAKFQTYSWQKGQPAFDKTIDAQIVAAVDAELARLGMTRTTSAPFDVLVTYYSIARTDVDLKGKPDAKGQLPQLTVGTLAIALLEPPSLRRVLRLKIDKPIDTEPAKLEAAINSAVAEMFTKFPKRKNK